MSPETITILAAGPSARHHLHDLEGFVIGVKDAAILAPCDAAISMDRTWTESRWPALVGLKRPTWLRAAAVRNIADRPPWLNVFECNHTSTTLTDEPGRLNGTHSGLCAVNLAYQMRPRRVVLVGFDCANGPDGAETWMPPYPWKRPGGGSASKFKAWAMGFSKAAGQLQAAGIEVVVRGHTAIRAFGGR